MLQQLPASHHIITGSRSALTRMRVLCAPSRTNLPPLSVLLHCTCPPLHAHNRHPGTLGPRPARHPTAGSAIARALTANAGRPSRLRKLELPFNRIGSGTALAFGAALAEQGRRRAAPADGCCGSSAPDDPQREPRGLADLCLSFNAGIGDLSAAALAKGLLDAGPWLRQLDLDNTAVSQKGYGLLLPAAEGWRVRHAKAAAEAGVPAPPPLYL